MSAAENRADDVRRQYCETEEPRRIGRNDALGFGDILKRQASIREELIPDCVGTTVALSLQIPSLSWWVISITGTLVPPGWCLTVLPYSSSVRRVVTLRGLWRRHSARHRRAWPASSTELRTPVGTNC